MNADLKKILKGSASITATGAVDTVISEPFVLSGRSCTEGLRIMVKASAVTDGSSNSSIVCKLQTSPVGGTSADWTDFDATNAKVAITAAGWFHLPVAPWNTNLATKFPLPLHGRVSVTSASGDTYTIDDVLVVLP